VEYDVSVMWTLMAADDELRVQTTSMDDDHHYQEWSTAINPLVYDPVQGRAQLGLSLLFKQWNQRSRARLFSYADDGSARVRADLALVQLRQGRVEEEAVVGTVHWKATGGAARIDSSKFQQVLF
jgi:hypothetical protein